MAVVERVEVEAYRIPVEGGCESDGTLAWRDTTMVLARAFADGVEGIGFTYAHAACASLVAGPLAELVTGSDPMHLPATWDAMRRATRNLGSGGLAWYAISAVDTALWDLKARLLDVPLAELFGAAHPRVPVYGSGGFTSYDDDRLQEQLGDWAALGFGRVKMKVGRDPSDDARRVALAREVVGPCVGLMVDANGAYRRQQALAQAERFAEHGVDWFEEPVSSDDVDGLRWLRGRAPAGMAISAGEYGDTPASFRQLLDGEAVDVLQADATRCGGFSGLLRVAALCETYEVPLSTHTAPSLHLHAACSLVPLIHLEWFHDHARIERELFEGFVEPVDGCLTPDPGRPGHGLRLRRDEARRYAA